MIAVRFTHALVVDDFHQQRRGLPGSRTPDDIASRGCVPLIPNRCKPRTEEFVPLPVRADAQRLEIPAVLPIVLRCQLAP